MATMLLVNDIGIPLTLAAGSLSLLIILACLLLAGRIHGTSAGACSR